MADWTLDSSSTKYLKQIPYQEDFADLLEFDDYPKTVWRLDSSSTYYSKQIPYKLAFAEMYTINDAPNASWVLESKSEDEFKQTPYKRAFPDMYNYFDSAPKTMWVLNSESECPYKLCFPTMYEVEEMDARDKTVPSTLPKDLLSGMYKKPDVFLCEPDKTKICKLDIYNFKGDFVFNSLSEISFEIGRIYNDFVNGQNRVNPYYDKIEALRLVYVEGFGYYEIQGPKISSDGIKEIKEVSAKSYEYILSQKYLSNFYINTGEVDSVEVIVAKDSTVTPVTLYNKKKPELSLLHLILEKIYGWTIGHVDTQLKTLSRTFSVDRMSVYDFIMNEICDKFNCLVRFDTVNNTINLYAESETAKFIGDGTTKKFVISPPFYEIGTVSVDGYKTTQWTYNSANGTISLDEAPKSGAHIEVVDKSLKPWETDVLVAFENLSNKMDISYSADDIKTVLTVTYGDDNDIRETNLGLPYLTDISYYYNVDWMGQELYDDYTAYLQKTNTKQLQYTNNSKMMQEIAGYIDFEENRLSLGYSISQVGPTTTGTYYIKGGSDASPYYTEVSLPSDYNANTTYYKIDTANLSEEKVQDLYNVIRYYFMAGSHPELEDGTEIDWEQSAEDIRNDFKFMASDYTKLIDDFKSVGGTSTNRMSSEKIQNSIHTFLKKMWNEIGRTPLKSLYYESYKQVQTNNITAGWSEESSYNYPLYYPVVLMLESINKSITEREDKIKYYQSDYEYYQASNEVISNSLLLSNNFTETELVRLSAFLREDELKIDDIVETENDTLLDSYKNKQHAMESGRIELSKISQPRLEFSMTMANIYAIPEFEPIINQFQLGNVIKIRLRPDYTKQSRLLGVHINFDDLSDFSCDFGDLTNLRTQSDIHADLLANAISAGKQVATNASYWTKGSDTVTSLDLKIQNGLLDTVESLKSSDPNQNVSIDKYGIHLEAVSNVETGEVSPKKVWMVNDKIVFTDDNFKTSKSIIGEYTITNENNKAEKRWGLISEYVNAGLIEGCQMIGGTIKIGPQGDGTYAFEVHEDGSVTMHGGSEEEEDDKNLPIISEFMPIGVEVGQLWLDKSAVPYILKIYNPDDENADPYGWVQCAEQTGCDTYTTKPDSYKQGDLWILSNSDAELYYKDVFEAGTVLKATETSSVFSADHWVDSDIDGTKLKKNMTQYFDFTPSDGLKIGQKDEKFHVMISSTEMGFYEKKNGVDQKVVWINDDKAHIEKLEVVNEATFTNKATFTENVNFKDEIHFFDKFVLKQESDGSISLALGV